MGLLNKLKNMFTEEVEVEVEPIKKEVIQVEIPAPARQEKKENIVKEKKEEKIVVTDSPALKKEEKNSFPMFFDDDFDVLDKKEKKEKIEKREVTKVVEKPVIPPYGIKVQQKKEETKRVFKPTPIISPVYGILDKDYRKEDLSIKKTSDSNNIKKNNYSKDNKELTIDDIRNKAFGTLEDEIEKNMDDSSFYLEEGSYDADMFDNFFDEESDNDASIDELLNKELYKTEEDVNINIDNKVKKDIVKNDKKKTRSERLHEIDSHDVEELNKDFEDDINLDDSDLLNMIDSMYQEGDEQ